MCNTCEHFISFPIVVYPSEFEDCKRYTAHCLNMDIVADDDTVEGAVSSLLEDIHATLEASGHFKASPFRDAPKPYWEKFAQARKMPAELCDRICLNVNKGVRADPQQLTERLDLRELVDDLQAA